MLPPRAYTFIGLNVVRFLSVIALMLAFASSLVTLAHDIRAVNRFVGSGHVIGQVPTIGGSANQTTLLEYDYIAGSTVPNQPAGAFWAVVNRLLIIAQTIVLVLSELGWACRFFDRYFPILGSDFGVGPVGIMQGLIGASILSHRVDMFSVVSAFFLFSVGCLNILVGLIWRKSVKLKRSITSWREHAKSVLPTHVAGVDVRPAMGAASNILAVPSDQEKKKSKSLGFGRQGEKAAGYKGYLLSKPVESLPRYVARPAYSPVLSSTTTVI